MASGSYKAGAVDQLLASDPSGRLRVLHDRLVALGLKTKIGRNTETLLFSATSPSTERVAVLAMRGGNSEVLSFPKAYWIRYVASLDAALAHIQPRHVVPTEGPFSSSQNSLRQIRVSAETVADLHAVIEGTLRTHVELIQRGE